MAFLEIELRYKIDDPEAFLAALPQGVTLTGQDRLVDQWFAPSHVRNMQQEKQWFDENKGVAWRLRRAQQAGGATVVSLTSKQLTEHNSHNSFHETTAPYTDHAQAVAWLHGQDYRNWLTIDKTRYALHINGEPEVEAVLDVIAGLKEKIGVGACLELEYRGKAERHKALEHLERVAQIFGLQSADQFQKSLTVVSMDALADFEG